MRRETIRETVERIGILYAIGIVCIELPVWLLRLLCLEKVEWVKLSIIYLPRLYWYKNGVLEILEHTRPILHIMLIYICVMLLVVFLYGEDR